MFSKEGKEVYLADIIKYLIDKKGIILVVVVIITAIYSIYSYIGIESYYEATARLCVKENYAIENSQVSNEHIVNDYSEIIKSQPIYEDVINTLNLNMAIGELADMISVSNPENTFVIQIAVRNIDNELATAIANQTLLSAYNRSIDFSNNYTLEIVEYASVPIAMITTGNIFKICILTFVAGLFAICILLSIVFVMKDTIKNKNDIIGYLNASFLCELNYKSRIDFNRIGKSNYLSLCTFRNDMCSTAYEHSAVFLCTINSIRNVEKVYIDLAKSLVEKGKKVLFIDINNSIDKKVNVCKIDSHDIIVDYDNCEGLSVIKNIYDGNLISRIKDDMEKFKQEYDFVLLNVAPLEESIEAVCLLECCNLSILTIERNVTYRNSAILAKDFLESGNCNNIGMILMN